MQCSLSDLAKNISHFQVLVIYFFRIPPIKLKLGLQMGEETNLQGPILSIPRGVALRGL
jgi:hypothetical protein